MGIKKKIQKNRNSSDINKENIISRERNGQRTSRSSSLPTSPDKLDPVKNKSVVQVDLVEEKNGNEKKNEKKKANDKNDKNQVDLVDNAVWKDLSSFYKELDDYPLEEERVVVSFSPSSSASTSNSFSISPFSPVKNSSHSQLTFKTPQKTPQKNVE